MKIHSFYFLVSLMGASCLFQSCTRTGDDVWDDTKSAGRHVQRGIRSLGGKQGDSRQISSYEEFECIDDECAYPGTNFQEYNYTNRSNTPCDYVPLIDQEHQQLSMDEVSRQPRETPGEPGSTIPSIEAFRDPSTIPYMASTFRNIYFEYNSSLIKSSDSLQTIHDIADFMQHHPRVYVFIEGHTDERGPQLYNFALGARRSNTVRNLLINEGVNPDRLFTVSYGKERPLVLENHEEAWSKNRRVEFKVYER